MNVDLFEFARDAHEAEGEIAVARLTRVDSPEPTGALRWRAIGSRFGRDENLRLDLAVDGAVTLTCQRCLQPMEQPIAIDSKFVVVADEQTAEALDDDDAFDAIVGTTDFDLDALVEDEVLLALPIAPKHAVCPAGFERASVSGSQPSPFAALAALRIPDGPDDAPPDDTSRH